jgi:hypothetical protein
VRLVEMGSSAPARDRCVIGAAGTHDTAPGEEATALVS